MYRMCHYSNPFSSACVGKKGNLEKISLGDHKSHRHQSDYFTYLLITYDILSLSLSLSLCDCVCLKTLFWYSHIIHSNIFILNSISRNTWQTLSQISRMALSYRPFFYSSIVLPKWGFTKVFYFCHLIDLNSYFMRKIWKDWNH